MSFKIYVIHSNKPLNDLKSLLKSCGGCIHAGIIYKSLHRNSMANRGKFSEKEETLKTIVFCPESTIQELKKRYPQFNDKVSDYDWNSFPLPDPNQGETWDLHISGFPKDFMVDEARKFVTNSLEPILPEYGSDGKRNYKLEFPVRLRETGEIYGFGNILFSESVNKDSIKLCKLILHNTPVYSKTRTQGSLDRRMVVCVWNRPPQVAARSRQMYYPSSLKKPRFQKTRVQLYTKSSVTQLGQAATGEAQKSSEQVSEKALDTSSGTPNSSEATNPSVIENLNSSGDSSFKFQPSPSEGLPGTLASSC